MIGRILNRAQVPMLRRALFAAGRATATQRVSLVAAGCAFYATLALFPTITMLISLYGLAYNPDTVQPQLHYLRSFMPPAAYALISERIQSLVAQPARGLGVNFALSLLLSLWSSSTGMKSIINALTLAYAEREERSIIRFQLISLGMTLVAVVGTALAIGVLVLIPVAVRLLRLPGDAEILAGLLSSVAMLGFIVMSLGLVYRYGPAGGGRIFYAPGAGLATVAWLVVSWAFGLYVGHFAAYSVTYGPLSTLIGLMMWFYLTAYAMLFGAEVNAALDREWEKTKTA